MITILCPRCGQEIEGVPDGCRDPSCPRTEIEDRLTDRENQPIWREGRAMEIAWGVGKCCRGLAPVTECECEKPLAAYRLLREALDRSEREGDFTAVEITWRADVRAVLGIDPDETNRS